MAKGYTDWVNMVCKHSETAFADSLKLVPLDMMTVEELKMLNELEARKLAVSIAMIYDHYRRAGFNSTSAEVRVRWLMEIYVFASIEGRQPDISDTFIPTTLDVADAIIDKAAADETTA